MYDFIDVVDVSESTILPSEAMKLNGEYLENIVDGYRTLYVKGRESLETQIETFETGASDGETSKYRRFPSRTLTVGYQIIAKSNEAFRDAFNKFNDVLNIEDAEIIFNDEPDKFFVGTPIVNSDIEPGKNIVTGEFDIFCAKPFKYSVEEFTATGSEEDPTQFIIDYDGVYKSYPTIYASFTPKGEEIELTTDSENEFDPDADEQESNDETIIYEEDDGTQTEEVIPEVVEDEVDDYEVDCGFVAFSNENEDILQFGSEQEDTETYNKQQVLLNTKFNSYGTVKQALWRQNDVDNGAKTTNSNTVIQSNTAHLAVKGDASKKNTKMLYCKNTGSGTKYHGASIMAMVPADKAGDVGAVNFQLNYKQRFCMTKGNLYTGILPSGTLKKNMGVQIKKKVDGKWKDTKTSSELSSERKEVKRLQKFLNWYLDLNLKCDGKFLGNEETAVKSFQLRTSLTRDGIWRGNELAKAKKVRKKNEKECGIFQCLLLDGNNKIVAGVVLQKSVTGSKCRVDYWINGQKKTNVSKSISVAHINSYFGYGGYIKTYKKNTVKHRYVKAHLGSVIRKEGSKVIFDLGYCKKVTLKNKNIKSTKVKKVLFFMGSYADRPKLVNGLYNAKFRKYNCKTSKDIANTFNEYDVLKVDCEEGEVYLNEVSSPELGALGNDWESFCLHKGINQIKVNVSDFTVQAGKEPNVIIKYRKVYI